jgi:adenylate cyclase
MRTSQIQDISILLLEREVKGLRLIVAFRLLAVIIMVGIHFFVGKSFFEKFSVAALTLLVVTSGIYFFYLLSKRKFVQGIGVSGAILDCIILAVLPFIWYESVGGSTIPASYMLKTPNHLTMAFGFVIINCFAARALYPLILTVGVTVGRILMYIYAANDPRTVFSEDFLSFTFGATVSPNFYFTGLMIFVLTGLGAALFTYQVRKTIVEAVLLERTTRQLKRYFSPNIFPTIANAGGEILSKGKRCRVAIMFADIRDFTSISETMPPEDVVDFLSDYHARMTTSIFAFGGTLDKFMGDGIMATFGTPAPSPDDALRAVQAGLAMKQALAELNLERSQKHLPALRQGIGIHYGEVIVGNIGSEERLEYTVIGDSVNLASRIEGACKELGKDFLISDAVLHYLNDSISTIDMGDVMVKGKTEAVRLYAVSAV